MMNIAIVGAGSIGGLFAAKLSNAGVENLLVHSRGTMGEAFISTGINVSGLTTHRIPVSNFFPSIAEVGIPPEWKQASDLIIITGKSTHAEELIETAHVLSHSNQSYFHLQMELVGKNYFAINLVNQEFLLQAPLMLQKEKVIHRSYILELER